MYWPEQTPGNNDLISSGLNKHTTFKLITIYLYTRRESRRGIEEKGLKSFLPQQSVSWFFCAHSVNISFGVPTNDLLLQYYCCVYFLLLLLLYLHFFYVVSFVREINLLIQRIQNNLPTYLLTNSFDKFVFVDFIKFKFMNKSKNVN